MKAAVVLNGGEGRGPPPRASATHRTPIAAISAAQHVVVATGQATSCTGESGIGKEVNDAGSRLRLVRGADPLPRAIQRIATTTIARITQSQTPVRRLGTTSISAITVLLPGAARQACDAAR